MTHEFKYASSSGNGNYNKKLSSADNGGNNSSSKANNKPTNMNNLTTAMNAPPSSAGGADDGTRNKPHPRLKKSFSECEYYENCGSAGGGVEINFNLSPSRRKYQQQQQQHHDVVVGGGDLQHHLQQQQQQQQQQQYHHHRLKQTSINDIAFIDGGGGGGGSSGAGKLQYNYDTLKSQYLLQQQQKLKEYKNDPNYLPNGGDNYSSESSTETRGILKNSNIKAAAGSAATMTTTDSYSRNSLKRNKGLSTLSLCSCDADTEVNIQPI